MSGWSLRVSPGREVSQPLWGALRAAQQPASISELHVASRAHPNSIQLRLGRWVRAGFVTALPAEPWRFAIAADMAGRSEPPTGGDLSRRVWRALREAGAPATVSELQATAGSTESSVYQRLTRWAAAGFVIITEGRPTLFAMSSSAPDLPNPPRTAHNGRVRAPRTMRERLWSAMRVLKSFDVPTIMISAEASRRSTEDFINCLQRAGYLRMTYRGCSARGDWSTYQLVRRSGTATPVVSHGWADGVRYRHLIDPNDGSIHDIAPGRRLKDRTTTPFFEGKA